MVEKLRESRGWQLLAITSLILIVPLLVDINSRMENKRRMRQEQARLEAELAEVQAINEALQQELEYVTSDEYLEEWARVEARMSRPGEVAIIPLVEESSGSAATDLESASSDTKESLSISEQWRHLFFGAPSASQP